MPVIATASPSLVTLQAKVNKHETVILSEALLLCLVKRICKHVVVRAIKQDVHDQ